MAHGGFGVARHEGRVVFVADVIPGETVLAQVTDDSKKSFWRAVAVEVLSASPDRVAHIWEEARIERAPEQRVGGADYGHIALERQRRLKEHVIADALKRFAGVEQAVSVTAVEPTANWRSRLSLHVNSEGVAGPRAARSHEVVSITTHPLAHPAMVEDGPWKRRFDGIERLDVVATSTGEFRVIARPPAGQASSTPHVTEMVNGRPFVVDQSGFWQVHVAAPETLQVAVKAAIDPNRLRYDAEHYDLYGGVGLLAVALAEMVGPGARVTSVESSPQATENAQHNLSDWVGARPVTARVDQYLRRNPVGHASTVILDPPRSGAGREVMQSLLRSNPAQIIYVACDPVAFARDLGFAREAGWTADSITAFDLFPHTHHVELVARIVRESD